VGDLRPAAVRVLAGQLERLPGIGARSARALVEHLLTVDPERVQALAGALAGLRSAVRHCERCFSLTEEPLCPVCRDPGRDRRRLLVVEDPTTVWAVEATGEYDGDYHVLLGCLSPLHGIGPEELTIGALLERVRQFPVEELILATDPTVEGETTALYIARQLEGADIAISRPASGIPVGGELAAVDRLTLAQALQLRRRI
jgi:recombination protein RecR